MKFRALAIAALFASLMGTAALHADEVKDWDHLNGHGTMTYTNIYVHGGETAAVGVRGDGNTYLRLSVHDNNNHLITTTVCRNNNCILTWTAAWNGSFYATVENLTGYGTYYHFALEL
jgi:hypothetical protein